jgi:GNAT superfamily N-acetyltransferase
MEGLEICSLRPTDCDAVVRLLMAQLHDHQLSVAPIAVSRTVQSIAEDRRYGFILVASVASAPVGVAYASALMSLEHGGESGWLEELYVLPEARGRGVGTRLVDAVVQEAARRGWRAIDLEVEAGHEQAARIYQRRGFQQRNRHRWYLDVGRSNDA